MAGNQAEAADRTSQRVGTYLRYDGGGSLPNVNRALMQRNPSVRFQADAHRRRIGKRGIPAPVPHSCYANASPERAGRIRVELHSFFARGLPSRPQGFQTGPYADSLTEHLSSYRGSFAIQRVQDSKFEPIHREAIGEFVVELLLSDSRLRNAETAKSPGGHQVRMHRASQRPVIGNIVRP